MTASQEQASRQTSASRPLRGRGLLEAEPQQPGRTVSMSNGERPARQSKRLDPTPCGRLISEIERNEAVLRRFGRPRSLSGKTLNECISHGIAY